MISYQLRIASVIHSSENLLASGLLDVDHTESSMRWTINRERYSCSGLNTEEMFTDLADERAFDEVTGREFDAHSLE